MASNETLGENARVLVTGGAGFIGSQLADRLLRRGCQVTVIDNLSTGCMENVEAMLPNPRFSIAIETVTNDVVLDRLVADCDVVFHLAAAVGVELILRDPVQVLESNILGVQAVLNAANRYRKKVLIASSSEIYGKSEDVPFGEEADRLLGPTSTSRWSYSTSKAVGEYLGLAYHRQMRVPVVIFRLFNTVGPGQTGRYGMVVPRFVKQALRGEPLTVYGDGQQSRCFCDVRDSIRGIVGLAESVETQGQVYNIGSQEEVTIVNLARRILSLVNGDGSTARAALESEMQEPAPITGDDRIRLVPYDQAYEPGFEDMRSRVPDLAKIRQATGWAPQISLDETLKRIIRHYRERPQEATGEDVKNASESGNGS